VDLRGLGYVAIEARDAAAWNALLVDAFGLMPAPGPPGADGGADYYRMDERSWRFNVAAGERDAFTAAGWELADARAFDDAVARLSAHGVTHSGPDDALAAARGVAAAVGFDDPFGNRHELYFGAGVEEQAFVSPTGVSGFLTDGVGLGHVLYAVPSCADAEAFFCGVLGFRVTDRFAWGPNGALFLRCSQRHHSLAFIDLPLPGGPGCNHVMVEALHLEDVGRAYDRVMDAKVPIVNSLGQHSNDPMLSFYVQSPSGFNLEFGWKGLMVDDRNWSVRTFSGRGELWGHRGDFMDDIAAAKV
jgi:3,4-dihydroxy-9,10-secoandrosta-1,3,5(10)-triene-9,17-dione 4,5-dioxygenase